MFLLLKNINQFTVEEEFQKSSKRNICIPKQVFKIK
jgi:hypothetical protein